MAGDLVSELDIVATSATTSADMGGTLTVQKGEDVRVAVRFKDPEAKNANSDNPKVARVDLIVGDVRGAVADRNSNRNDTTRVIARFTGKEWTRNGDVYSINYTLPRRDRNIYVRVRGTIPRMPSLRWTRLVRIPGAICGSTRTRFSSRSGSRDAGRTRTYRRRTTPRDLLREMRNQNPFNREERS